MNAFATPRIGAGKPRPPFRARVGEQMRRVASHIAAVNGRIDEARARRDRANHEGRTVDGAYWIFLR